MGKAIEARIAAIERALNPCATGPTTIVITGGCTKTDDGPFEASGGTREWISAPGETFAAFEDRVLRDATGISYLVFGGLPYR